MKESPDVAEAIPSSAQHANIHGRLFQNIAGLLGGRVVSLALSAASSIILARYLGSAGLGGYAALYAYLALFGWLGSFGLDQILTRESARRRADAGSILVTGTFLGVLFYSVATALAWLLAPVAGYTGQFRWLLALAAVDMLILTPLRWPGMVFQVDLRQWIGVSVGLIRQVVWILVIVVCALSRASLGWVIVGHLFCGLFETVLTLALSFRFFTQPWRILFGEIRTLLVHAAPLALVLLAVTVYHRIDQVLLHRLVNDRELGYYVSAVNLTEVFSALPVAVMASLFPILSQLHNDEERFLRYTSFSFRYLITAAFGLCLVVTLAAPNVIHLLYGSSFQTAAPMLAVLIWSEGAVFFGVVIANALIARNLQRVTLAPAILGALVNLGLNLVMIPRWGGLGAAWATTISYTIASVLGYLLFPAAWSLARLGLRAFLSAGSLAMVLTFGLLLVRSPVIVKLVFGGLAYACGIWFMGLMNHEDISRALSLFGHKKPAGSL